MTASPRVSIAVHGRFHAVALAEGLRRRDHLAQLITTYPAFVVRRFVALDRGLVTVPWLEAWRRAQARVRWLPDPTPGLMRRFGRAAATALDERAEVAVAWSSVALEPFARAEALGQARVLERGSTHIAAQDQILVEEHARLGLPHRPIHPEIVARELAEYEAAQRICVPTSHAARTFTDRGIPAARLTINPYGVDAARFTPPPRRDEGAKPAILFAGQVGPRKGVPVLLRAFAPLSKTCELWIAGPVEPGMEAVLARAPTEGVRFLGPLDKAALIETYRRAAAFCLPSVEEGFGMVLLEAMACGLPVVATDVGGGADLIDGGRNGRTVPAGDEAGLRAALEAILDLGPEGRAEMGARARRFVETRFTWDAYVDRAVAIYRALLDERGRP